MLDYYVLPDALHGVMLATDSVFDEVNFSKSASPNYTEELEVVECHLRHCGSPIKQTRAGGATFVGLINWNLSIEGSLLRLSLC